MLNALIRFSLTNRLLVLVAALTVLLWGGRTALKLPVDVLPDLTKPTVTILTEAPGLAPEEVETLVTVPLEQALMGVTGVSRMRTVNDVGLSLAFVEFDWGTDIYRARQLVQERLTGAAERLPEGVAPYLTPVTSLMGNIMLIGLVDPSGERLPRELRTLADWTVARRLQAIPGIAEVLPMGGGVAQVQVQPDPERMRALGVNFEELREGAAHAVGNTTGGFLVERSEEIMVRNLSMTTDLDAIANTVVRYENDRPISIGDVADVVWGTEPMRGDAGLGSHLLASDPAQGPAVAYPGVILSVTKAPGFDTIALTDRLESAMVELQATLPKGVELLTVYRQADFIELSIGNLEEALRDGAIMVALVLFLFLLNLRVTVITLTAIPLSLAMTFLVFDWFNVSLNSMTLGGLAVAIGMVVDDAIVDVENIYRRLRENAARAVPRPKAEVIFDASLEVRSSILYATILIILVFVPLLALTGLEGRLFTPIAVATMTAMAASFFVSITVTNALSYYLLRPRSGSEKGEWAFVRGLKWFFRKTWLDPALSFPLVTLLLCAILMVLAWGTVMQMTGNFLPSFREPTALIATTTSPGTSLAQTTRIGETATDLLLRVPGVETVGYRVGRAERGDHVVPVSTVEFDVEFEEPLGRPRQEVLEDLRNTMRTIPGTFSALSTPLGDRIGHMLSGVSAPVAIKIFGPDLGELRRLGEEVVNIAREVPGLEEARMEQQAAIPQLRIEPDRGRSLAYGLTPGEVTSQLSALMDGLDLADLYEGERIYDLVLRLSPEWRESPERLREIYFDTRSGQQVPLGAVADLRLASGPNTILRENTLRRLVVSINPTTEDLNTAVETLQEQVREQLSLPSGYTVSFEGEYQAQQAAKRTIAITAALILMVMSVLLYAYFRSVTLVILVFTMIPLSLIGGVFYTAMTLNNISIATLVGFIAVSGIAARNNIMLLSHYLHLMRHEGEGFTRQMVVRGTQERLVPVLSTAISAGLALVPLLLAAGEPGKEILNPIAIVIVGGLVSSTFLGLGVTPSLFYAFGRKAATAAVETDVESGKFAGDAKAAEGQSLTHF
ncbi:MAG: efflux RND transporter permease subunit [Puniceicoccales bacterium]